MRCPLANHHGERAWNGLGPHGILAAMDALGTQAR